MSEPLNDLPVPQTVAVAADKTDAILAKVKELLKVAGHDVEAVFDDLASLAKKLA